MIILGESSPPRTLPDHSGGGRRGSRRKSGDKKSARLEFFVQRRMDDAPWKNYSPPANRIGREQEIPFGREGSGRNAILFLVSGGTTPSRPKRKPARARNIVSGPASHSHGSKGKKTRGGTSNIWIHVFWHCFPPENSWGGRVQ